jgi:enoyl-CoA hydratase/carnithine racemase
MSINTTTHNGVTTIEIARPDKKNAITAAMYQSMADALRAADADPVVRAVVITGQPGIFTAGNDLQDFMQRPPQGPDSPVAQFMTALVDTDKPVIVAVTGQAVGIGVTMLLHCDLVYVADDARLVMPFVTLGLVPEFGSSLLLPQLMGHARAAEKLLLGESISASEAVACGLANAALPAAQVLAHAQAVAARIVALAPGAVRQSKQLIRGPRRPAVREAIQREAEIFGARLRSPEAMEAFQAFFQRRKPDFSKF